MVLTVRKVKNGQQEIRWPAKHSKSKQIQKWLDNELSPGYIEYLLKFGTDPHCNTCRDTKCENVGGGDDACKGFKYGDRW